MSSPSASYNVSTSTEGWANAPAREQHATQGLDADTADNSENHAMSLLKMQIGPVQEFIAQARSTRDLWSGSYLLSWLVAAGIRRLQLHKAELVFPNPAEQPLLEPKWSSELTNHAERLTPNFTNIFVAVIPAEMNPKVVAEDVRQAIADEWRAIYSAVWTQCQAFIDVGPKDRFESQVQKFLTVSWQITPLAKTDYASAYGLNSWQLDAVRQTRDFQAWSTGATETGAKFNKDSLSGKEEAVAGGPGFVKRLAEMDPKHDYAFLFKHDDWLGAVAVVKRVWHLAFLKEERGLKTSSSKRAPEFPIRSTRAIAAKTGDMDDDENVETAPGEKYFAVLAFDGDQIGKWLSGEFLADGEDLRSHQTAFSTALSSFALNKVRSIVEEPVLNGYGGFLVYAGGDDVLALLPAERALKCAHELREAFQTATKGIVGEKKEDPDANGQAKTTPCRPDASVGIAIAHFKAPLQDVVRAAQAAEKRAKQKFGRSAVAVSLFKRSGEILEWGCQWEDGALALHKLILAAMGAGQLSAKFPHRLTALLDPYRIDSAPLVGEAKTFADAAAFTSKVADELIGREFAHALSRQHGPQWPREEVAREKLRSELTTALTHHLAKLNAITPAASQTLAQEKLARLTGLLTSVAFADRNRDGANADLKSDSTVSEPSHSAS